MFTSAVPAAPPVIPPVTAGDGQVYVVDAGTIPLVPSAGDDVKLLPLHIVAFILEMAGFGSTVTVTVKVAPVQVPDFGVTVYVAVCRIFVELPSAPLMFAALVTAAPPVRPPETVGAAHV